MAEQITARAAIERGITLINPPVEIDVAAYDEAVEWLSAAAHPGHFHAQVCAEGEVRTGFFMLSDQTVCTRFRRRWGRGTQALN